MRILNYIVLGFMVLALFFYIGSKSKPYQIISGKTMGTYYNIKIRSSVQDNLLNNEIKIILDDVVGKHSAFDSSSELSKINNDTTGEWISLSNEMSELMKTAYNVYKATDGAFDPTVGGLVELWGFGPTGMTKKPSSEDIKAVLEYTGFSKVKFSDKFKKIKKTHPKLTIDLSSIAKGHAVDMVAKLLKNKGYNDFVIDIGGEVKALGEKSPDVNGWVVGVLKPSKDKNENAFVVTLKNMSAATSGDYRNFYDVDGETYSHIINPKTGNPIKNMVSSVTIFDKECTSADAYSTAIMVMGAEKGLAFANSKKIAAIIFVYNSDGSIVALLSDKAGRMVIGK